MNVLREHIDYIDSNQKSVTAQITNVPNEYGVNGYLPNGHAVPAELHDLETPAITTISRQVSNGYLANGHVTNGHLLSGDVQQNGLFAQGRHGEEHI